MGNHQINTEFGKKRELTEDEVSKLADESENKCRETNTNTLDSSDGGIDHINEIQL